MKDLKVVFMGTPLFSVPVLEGLIENTNVIGVVTQPDKEVGRKRILTKSPVKELAEKYNIKVLQPIKLRNEYQDIINLNPDIIITCADGQILPEELIYAPKYNTINVHASLLPKYRGGAPIHHAILNGDKETGITIMYTDKGMDTGDIISMESIPINNDNYLALKDKLSILGKDLLLKTLPSIIDKTAKRIKQNDNDATYAYAIKREDEKLDFNNETKNVLNKIKALCEIGSYVYLDEQEVKIFEAEEGNMSINNPGKITNIYKNGIGVSTKDGEIIITKLQMPGKKIMNARDFLNGVDKEKLKEKSFK